MCVQSLNTQATTCAPPANRWLELAVHESNVPTGEPALTNLPGVDIQDIWVQKPAGVMNPIAISSGEPAEVLARDGVSFETLNEGRAEGEKYCIDQAPPKEIWSMVGLSFENTIIIEFPESLERGDVVHFNRPNYQYCRWGGTPKVRLGNKEAESWGVSLVPVTWNLSTTAAGALKIQGTDAIGRCSIRKMIKKGC